MWWLSLKKRYRAIAKDLPEGRLYDSGNEREHILGVWLGTDDVCNIIGERTFSLGIVS